MKPCKKNHSSTFLTLSYCKTAKNKNAKRKLFPLFLTRKALLILDDSTTLFNLVSTCFAVTGAFQRVQKRA